MEVAKLLEVLEHLNKALLKAHEFGDEELITELQLLIEKANGKLLEITLPERVEIGLDVPNPESLNIKW